MTTTVPQEAKYPNPESYQVLNALVTRAVVAAHARASPDAGPAGAVDLRLAASGNVVIGAGDDVEVRFARGEGAGTAVLDIRRTEDPGAPTALQLESDLSVTGGVDVAGDVRCASHLFGASTNVLRAFQDGAHVGYGLRVGDDKRLELYRYHSSDGAAATTVRVQTFGILGTAEPEASDTLAFPGFGQSDGNGGDDGSGVSFLPPGTASGGWRVDGYDGGANPVVVVTPHPVAVGRATAEAQLHVGGDAQCDGALRCHGVAERADAAARTDVTPLGGDHGDADALVAAFRDISVVRFRDPGSPDRLHFGVDAAGLTGAGFPDAVEAEHVRLGDLLCVCIRVVQRVLERLDAAGV